MTAPRAYGQAAKDDRRQHILSVVDRLLSEEHVLPTASSIADAAGLAKGTIFLYFESREEIFAALLLDGWFCLLDELEAKLDVDGSRSGAVEAFLSSFVSLVQNRPSLMFLDAMLTDFKRKMSEAARHHFHAALHDRMDQVGGTLDVVLTLAPGRGCQLLVRSHAFARGLWQSFDPVGETCKPALPDRSYAQELREALAEYWSGAVRPTDAMQFQ